MYSKFVISSQIDDSHPCAQPKYKLQEGKVGCFAAIPRWYHNHLTGECESLTYDGCNKNANNFETKEDCKKTCDEWHEAHKDHQHQHKSSSHEDCDHDGQGHEHHGHDQHQHHGHDHKGHEHHGHSHDQDHAHHH